MTANHEHTPTTQNVQNAYVDTRYNLASEQGEFPPPIMERYAEFERWYKKVIAAAEQRGAAQAWDEGYQDGYNDGLSDGHNLDNMRDPNENPYRTDREGDDE